MSAYSAAILALLPVGYWKLDEPNGVTAFDSSGNGHNGTLGGTGTTLGVAGGVVGDTGTAYSFNGSGFVTLPALPTESNFSMIAIVKGNAAVEAFLAWRNFSIGISSWSKNFGTFPFTWFAGSVFGPMAPGGGSSNAFGGHPALPADGNYHHIAMNLVNGGGFTSGQCWIDGVELGSGQAAAQPFPTMSATGPSSIGGYVTDQSPNANNFSNYVGSMQHVAFVGRALTAGEIQNLSALMHGISTGDQQGGGAARLVVRNSLFTSGAARVAHHGTNTAGAATRVRGIGTLAKTGGATILDHPPTGTKQAGGAARVIGIGALAKSGGARIKAPAQLHGGGGARVGGFNELSAGGGASLIHIADLNAGGGATLIFGDELTAPGSATIVQHPPLGELQAGGGVRVLGVPQMPAGGSARVIRFNGLSASAAARLIGGARRKAFTERNYRAVAVQRQIYAIPTTQSTNLERNGPFVSP